MSQVLIEADTERDALAQPITRPPSYGTLSSPPPSFSSQKGEDIPSRKTKITVIDRKTLACLLLQHISSTLSNSLYHFATFIFTVEVYKDTLAPASLVGLATFASALFFSGSVGGIVDTTPRLRFVRTALIGQKTFIIFSFCIFLVLFGPLNGVPAKVFHADSTLMEKIQVNGMLVCTIISAVSIWMINIGINVAVERDWVTTIAQGDSQCLTKLNAYMTSIDLLSRIAGPMVVSFFTMSLSYVNAVRGLIILAASCGALEYYWVQVVYDRFPVLKEDEDRTGRGKIKLDDATNQETEVYRTGWRGEIDAWSEFGGMLVFWSSLAQSMCWITTLHLDATGVAHFKMAAGYSDIFLASIRGLCMMSCLVGTAFMPRLERRFGLSRTGIMGLSFGISCFICVLTAFFLEHPLRQHGSKTANVINTSVIFSGIVVARAGHTTFDLAQIKALQQSLEHHPRRNRMTALQTALQSLCALIKYSMTVIFPSEDTYKWTVLITFIANLGALSSYLNYIRLDRKAKLS